MLNCFKAGKLRPMGDRKIEDAFSAFAAKRIAEFPALYSCKEDVIAECILDSMGDCYWENGVLAVPNQHLRRDGKWTQYPLRMPLKTANELYCYKIPTIGWNMGNAQSPIAKLPKDANASFLEAIDLFLSKWERLGEAEWNALAVAHCIVLYGVAANPHAYEPQRTLKNYLEFMKKIPHWRAMIRAVEHYQEHGEEDPAVFQAAFI